jgi:hypothetical protein
MKHLNGLKGEVGFFDGETYSDAGREGISVADIARANNYGIIVSGTNNIPARPFFTYAANAMSKTWHTAAKMIMKSVLQSSGDSRKLLTQYLNLYKERIQLEILQMAIPKNAKKTIALKGFDDPLIRTGKMYDSVKFRISRGI